MVVMMMPTVTLTLIVEQLVVGVVEAQVTEAVIAGVEVGVLFVPGPFARVHRFRSRSGDTAFRLIFPPIPFSVKFVRLENQAPVEEGVVFSETFRTMMAGVDWPIWRRRSIFSGPTLSWTTNCDVTDGDEAVERQPPIDQLDES